MNEQININTINEIQTQYKNKISTEEWVFYNKYIESLESLKTGLSKVTEQDKVRKANEILQKLTTNTEAIFIRNQIRELKELAGSYQEQKTSVSKTTNQKLVEFKNWRKSVDDKYNQEYWSSEAEEKGILDKGKNTITWAINNIKSKFWNTTEQKEFNESEVKQLIFEFLDANDWLLDGTMSKIKTLLEKSENMTEEDLLNQIVSIDFWWDIENWDLETYAKENNIPLEKVVEMKNAIRQFQKEIWANNSDLINYEANRIYNSLEWRQEINIYNQTFHFESKKDALQFLFQNKILLKEISTFTSDILVWLSKVSNIAIDNPYYTLVISGAYIWTSVLWTIRRHVNGWFVRKELNWKFFQKTLKIKWTILNEQKWTITWIEQAEIEKRRAKINELRTLHWNNEEMLKIIGSLENNWANIADWKSSLWGEWFRESTFWRKVKNIENVKFINWKPYFPWKWLDTFWKPILFNSEKIDSSTKFLLQQIKENLLENKDWKFEIKKWTILDNFSKNTLLNHDIPNDQEKRFKKILDAYKSKIEYWWIWDIKWRNLDDFIEWLKSEILKEVNKNWLKLWSEVFSSSNLVDAYEFWWIKDLKIDDVLSEIEQTISLDKYKKIHLRGFIKEIQDRKNFYTKEEALDIIFRITNEWKTLEEAKKDSFSKKTQADFNNIKLSGVTIWDNIIELNDKIINWEYSLNKVLSDAEKNFLKRAQASIDLAENISNVDRNKINRELFKKLGNWEIDDLYKLENFLKQNWINEIMDEKQILEKLKLKVDSLNLFWLKASIKDGKIVLRWSNWTLEWETKILWHIEKYDKDLSIYLKKFAKYF